MPPRPSAATGSGGRGRGGRATGAGKQPAESSPTTGGAAAGRGRGRGRGGAAASAPRRGTSGTTSKASASNKRSIGTVEISDDDVEMDGQILSEEEDDEDDDEEKNKTIPPELLTRLLHEFFEEEGTRITRDANDAVAKYVDVFVREAIARTAVEGTGGFLEVSLVAFYFFESLYS